MAEKFTDIEMKPIEPVHTKRRSFSHQHVTYNLENMSEKDDNVGDKQQIKLEVNDETAHKLKAPLTWYLLEEWKYAPHIKRFFRCIALVNILSLAVNGPAIPAEYLSRRNISGFCESLEEKRIHFIVVLVVDVILSLLYSAQLFMRVNNSRHWYKLKSLLKDTDHLPGKRSQWLNYNHWARLIPVTITTVGLYGSVALESVRLTREDCNYEVPSPYYIIFVLRVVTLVSAVKLLSPLKISSNALQSLITKFRLKHLANVTVFYFAALYIFALIGVHEIGPLEYRCVSDSVAVDINTTLELCWADESDNQYDECMCEVNYTGNHDGCVSMNKLSIPDLHCRPCNDSGGCNVQYSCPDGYSCRKVNIGRNFGYYGHYDNLGMSLLTVYEVSTLELWSFQSYTALYGGRDVHFYYITIIFLLVIIIQQSIFLVVIIESFADIRSDSNLVIRSKPQPRPDFLLTDSRSEELEFTQTHSIPRKRSELLQSLKHYWPYFNKVMIILVLFDAIIVAIRGSGMEEYSHFVAVWEVVISVVFVLELLPYMAYYTPSVAIRRWQFWYLAIVAIGSLAAACYIKVIGYENFNGPERILVVFQASRFPRVPFLFSCIQGFFNDIIGKDRRIPIITLITVYFVFAIAMIHFQLFAHTSNGQCDMRGYRSFVGTFRSTFQVVTGEGWSEVMSELMFRNSAWWVLNIVFILTHLFASLILLNLFVAIILDNLDKDEENKRKELEERVQSTENDKVPHHLQLLDKLKIPTVRNKVKVAGVFDVPNIDESAVREYVQQGEQKLQEVVKEQHNNRKRMSYVEDIDDDEEEVAVDAADDDKLKLINVDSGQLLTVSGQRKSESIGQMVERISMWRRWSISSENNEFDQANNLLLLRHIAANRSFSVDLTVKPQKHTKLDEYLKKRPYINWSFFVFRTDNNFRKLCKIILEAKLNVPTAATQKDNNPVKGVLNKAMFLIRSVISQLPFFTWFMLFVTATLVIIQLHQLEHDFRNYASNGTSNSDSRCNFNPNDSSCRKTLYHHSFYVGMDITFVLFTVFELSLKAIAYGLFCGPHRVIHSVWDLISWLIVIGTVVLLANNYLIPPISMPPGSRIDGLAAFMLFLWALRPIRIISIVPPMRRGIVDILKGKLNFLMAFILLGGFLFMFASLGVQLFQDQFSFCNDVSNSSNSTCTKNCTGEFEIYIEVSSELIVPQDPESLKILVPRVAVQQPREFGFDNFGSALLTLLETLTLEGWIAIRDFRFNRDDPINRSGTNLYVLYVNLYLHIFVFFAVTIALQLFVGIIVSSFNENKSEHSGLLTVSQKRWIDLLHRIQLTRPVKLPPEPDKTKWNYYPYKLLHGRWKNVGKYIIVLMIVLNSLLLSVPWKELNESGMYVQDASVLYLRILFIIFQAFFVLFVILNLLTDGYVYFFLSIRNTVEFLFAVASVAYIIFAITFESVSDEQKDSLIEALTGFALGLTVVRLISALWKFNVLVNLFYTVIATVVNSIPLLGILLVVFCHYALVGTLFFSNVRTGDAIDYSFVNFDSTSNSLWTMVRVLTGEDWHLIMHDCAVSEPVCYCCDCGNEFLSYAYFLSFNILIVFIFVNVFIAVLLESFSLFYNEDDSCLDYGVIKDFVLVWSKFDPKASGRVSRAKIKLLMRSLKLDGFYTYAVKDGVRERVKYSKKNHSLLLREIALELSLEVRTTGQNSNWSQQVSDTASDTLVTFENMLKSLAYRTEDIYKRLTPLELKAREEMEIDVQSRVAFDCVKSWMEKYVKPILQHLQNQLQQSVDLPSVAPPIHPQSTEEIEVWVVPKELRRRRSYHRHSIVENPKWMMQHSETEQDNLPDINLSASLRGNRNIFSPSNSEDRPEVQESYRSSLKQGSNQVNAQQQQQQQQQQQHPASSYNSQFDWKRWYREKVDSDED